MNDLARRVAARYAKEFPSPQALREYLHEHPGADRSLHYVRKPGTPPPVPKTKPSVPPPPSAKEPEGKKQEPPKKKTLAEHLEGFSDSLVKDIKEAPKAVRQFITDDKFRRQAITSATETLTKSSGKLVGKLVEAAKHEVHEFKTASAGVKAVMSGKKMSSEQKKAFRTVATHVAIGAVSAALSAHSVLGVATVFGKNLVRYVALKAVSKSLGHIHVLGELGHAGHLVLDIMTKFSAEKEADPDKVLVKFVMAAVARELEGLDQATIQNVLKKMDKAKDKEASSVLARRVVARYQAARMV